MLNAVLIGDEIHYQGERVALLVASGVAPSTMTRFTDELEAGLLNEDERPDPCNCAHMKACPNYKAEDAENKEESEYVQALSDLLMNMKPFIRGGLLMSRDLERIVAQLKEEDKIDEAPAG